MRQAYAGIYQLLPLGLRVLVKIERSIDKHMQSAGASKVSLSSISSQKLWEQSGRLSTGSEIFKFEGRGKSKWLLTPTHEEEITSLLANEVFTERDLPVRLYQIGRKYRDEQRPRSGLLRGREFIMKDMYTFDATTKAAEQTYQRIREAYRSFFDELGVTYVEVRADSGNMGGDLSHEFHFPHDSGEDNIIHCSSCDYARNEEFVAKTDRRIRAVDAPQNSSDIAIQDATSVRDFISEDGRVLARVILPLQSSTEQPYSSADINTFAIKEAMRDVAEMNTGVEEHKAMQILEESRRTRSQDSAPLQVVYLVDQRVKESQIIQRTQQDLTEFGGSETSRIIVCSAENASAPINLIRQRTGDSCPQCRSGTLTVEKAIEIGHTFHLGTRYSAKLKLNILPTVKGADRTPVQMGCHGIGVTRLLAASVSCLSENDRIIWPRRIAPYDVIICTADKDGGSLEAAEALYDELAAVNLSEDPSKLDLVLDDRGDRNYSSKVKEAEAIGYGAIVTVGKRLLDKGVVELIVPRAAVREDVPLASIAAKLSSLV
jgi:prolyl-tRNA synthetase